jgi:hypothetical protein
VVAANRTRQGAGVSNGGTTIRVTGRPHWRQRIVRAERALKSNSVRHRRCDGAIGIEICRLLVPKA